MIEKTNIKRANTKNRKGSKMGAKMEPFGLPNLNYTRFGAPFGRNWGPKTEKKKVGKMVKQNHARLREGAQKF